MSDNRARYFAYQSYTRHHINYTNTIVTESKEKPKPDIGCLCAIINIYIDIYHKYIYIYIDIYISPIYIY